MKLEFRPRIDNTTDLVKILNPVVDLSLQEDLVLLQVSLLASIVEDVAEDP